MCIRDRSLLLDAALPRVIQFGIPALMIVAGSLYCSLGVNRFGLLLGESSYALYLSHGFVLGGSRIFLPVNPEGSLLWAWTYLATMIVLCIAAGVVIHVFVDDWLLRRERIWQLRAYLKQSHLK